MHLNAAHIMRYTRVLLLALPIFFTSCQQESRSSKTVKPEADVAEIRFYKNIYRCLRYEVVPKNTLKDSELSRISIQKKPSICTVFYH